MKELIECMLAIIECMLTTVQGLSFLEILVIIATLIIGVIFMGLFFGFLSCLSSLRLR